MKNKDLRTVMFNLLKGLIAMAFSGVVGNLLYFLIFRGTNAENPEGAAMRTSIFSLLIFALSIYLFLRMLDINSKSENIINEKQAIKDAYKESEYQLDYKLYFKKILKARLWGYILSAFVYQIPLIVNYVIADKYSVTVYELPIWIYEWNMPSIFAYEIFGGRWYIGAPLYILVFSAVFSIFAYRYYKQFLIKPSYL